MWKYPSVAKSLDWLGALDLDRAVVNLRDEFQGDWYRDPWWWPELGYMHKSAQHHVVEHLKGSGSRRPALIQVPKENWGSRPAVVLDILDRTVYQMLVDRHSVDLIGSLPTSVFGWRLRPSAPSRGDYSHNTLQWDSYRNHMASAAAVFDAALKTDLTSFFASIPISSIGSLLDDRCPKGQLIERLHSLIDGFTRISERTGLPQRSTASAVLANAFLQPLDDLLDAYAEDMPNLFAIGGSPTTRRSFARWMDDMWIFGHDTSRLRRAQVELQEVARSIGLHMNSAKTDVLEGEAVAGEAMQIEHSAVDGALVDPNDLDSGPLEELLDRLLENPEHAGRTSVKFATVRMRMHGIDYRLDDIVDAAPRMPHAADALADLFSHYLDATDYRDWTLDYATSGWATFEWATAQYVRRLDPAAPNRPLEDYLASRVAEVGAAVPLLASVATQLVKLDAATFRASIRAGFARTSEPHVRRILALAALEAGENTTQVRRWLGQEAENAITLEMLESTHFSVQKAVTTFGSSR